MMHDSSGQTWFGSNFEKIEFSRHGYDPDNTVGILKKDIESCLDAVDSRVCDLLCMINPVHASTLKEHDDNDDFQGTAGRAAERS